MRPRPSCRCPPGCHSICHSSAGRAVAVDPRARRHSATALRERTRVGLSVVPPRPLRTLSLARVAFTCVSMCRCWWTIATVVLPSCGRRCADTGRSVGATPPAPYDHLRPPSPAEGPDLLPTHPPGWRSRCAPVIHSERLRSLLRVGCDEGLDLVGRLHTASLRERLVARRRTQTAVWALLKAFRPPQQHRLAVANLLPAHGLCKRRSD